MNYFIDEANEEKKKTERKEKYFILNWKCILSI